MKPKRILVTGGAGFIGSQLVRLLLAEDREVEVVNLDALTYAGSRENLEALADEPRHRLVHGNILDAELVASLVSECDAVLHLAAETHVDRSIDDPRPFVETNVSGTQVLLEALRRAGGGARLVQAGTDEVYGSLALDSGEKFTESSLLEPNNPYAASKAAADMLVMAYGATHGLDCVIVRSSNNYGPRQFPEKVIPLFVSLLAEGKNVPLYGDGRHVRDWLHVDDCCRALLAALQHGKPGEVYNAGAGNGRSNLNLTRSILEIMGAGEERIEFVSDRPGHDLRYAMDCSKIERELGWKPRRTDWRSELAATVQWYLDNPEWIARARTRG
jgi:dTDP-glucose 4,6-dehydratase